MHNGPLLETPRLRICPLDEGMLERALYDILGVARLLGAEPVGQNYGFLEMVFKRRIYRAKMSLIRQNPNAWLLSTMWFMVEKNSGAFVGEAGFKGAPNSGEVEIGYSTRLSMRKLGYMTEAVGALCSFAFLQDKYEVNRVCALTNRDNSASHRVLEKNGFIHDGWRGRYWYWRKDRHSESAQS